mgnify:CR=1 FL=1
MKPLRILASLVFSAAISFAGISAPTAIAADPPPAGCGANAYWNGNSCVANQVQQPTQQTTQATFNCNGTQIPVGAYCPPATNTGGTAGGTTGGTQQYQQPTGGTTGGTTGGITCPAGSFFDQGINGCKSTTATAGTGTGMGTGGIVCTPAMGPPACPAQTGTTAGSTMNNAVGCMNGMIRDANGACIAPIMTGTGQIDCSAAANKVTTACGGNVAVQNNTANNNMTNNAGNNWVNCGAGFFYDEGIKGCKSTGATGGVVNQVATIKCKDGSVRVTAIECDNVGGGSAGVAITCPANQVVAPSGTYCIYPSTGGTNANAGTYRAECAANPPPASCLGQAVNTFEGNATMAKAANFTAYDPNALQKIGRAHV